MQEDTSPGRILIQFTTNTSGQHNCVVHYMTTSMHCKPFDNMKWLFLLLRFVGGKAHRCHPSSNDKASQCNRFSNAESAWYAQSICSLRAACDRYRRSMVLSRPKCLQKHLHTCCSCMGLCIPSHHCAPLCRGLWCHRTRTSKKFGETSIPRCSYCNQIASIFKCSSKQWIFPLACVSAAQMSFVTNFNLQPFQPSVMHAYVSWTKSSFLAEPLASINAEHLTFTAE